MRPFKTIQRAFLEVARFSYRVGLSNDEFDAFSIMLYPAEYVVDNRPGDVLYTGVAPIDENSNLDITSPNNVLYKYNSVEGGIIVPRGCSLVGTDLRRTKLFLSMFLTLQHIQRRVLTLKHRFLLAQQSLR